MTPLRWRPPEAPSWSSCGSVLDKHKDVEREVASRPLDEGGPVRSRSLEPDKAEKVERPVRPPRTRPTRPTLVKPVAAPTAAPPTKAAPATRADEGPYRKL
ncbi:MAG: hypothetical protein R3F43_03285 [bacterium]